MSIDAPTQRFSDRVAHYVKYRPGYPTAVLLCLRDEWGLTRTAVVADIGAGTGLLTRLFLDNGNPVYGVEPNAEMRAAGEAFLAEYPHFTSINGTAEATTLPDHSVDFIVAGQAAHWFDPVPTRAEWLRICKPGGKIALVWNTRHVDGSAFMQAYERILVTFARDDTGRPRREGGHERGPEHILGNDYAYRTFDNAQQFDYAGLEGRTLSSSMMPLAGHPQYEPMLAALHDLFTRYEEDGRVAVLYTTELYISMLD
jgi:SAM-dependent methyltransferase